MSAPAEPEDALTRLERLEARLDQIAEAKPKDFWDKLSSASSFLSGVVVAGAVTYFTLTYSNQQSLRDLQVQQHNSKILEMQSVEKFIPHLLSEDLKRQRLALVSIDILASSRVSTAIGALYPKPGVMQGLGDLAMSNDAETRAQAGAALSAIADRQRTATGAIEDPPKAWSPNSVAATYTWSTLQALGVIDKTFATSGDLLIDFGSPHASAATRKQEAAILATQLDNVLEQFTGARYEKDIQKDLAVSRLRDALLAERPTPKDLASVIDSLYMFPSE